MVKRKSGELKRLARECLTGNYPVPIFTLFAARLLPAATLMPFSYGVTDEWNAAWIVYILAAFILQVFGRLLLTGVSRIHLQLAKKQQVSMADLFWVFRNCPDRFILGTLLLYGLFLIPAVPAACGIVFFLNMKTAEKYLWIVLTAAAAFLAVLYLGYTFGMIYLLYIENPQMSVLEAFRISRSIMRGNKWRLFVMHLSFAGMYLLGICSAGIGMLWIYPYITQTTVNFYLDLTGCFDKENREAENYG